jgi:hypothetical protein
MMSPKREKKYVDEILEKCAVIHSNLGIDSTAEEKLSAKLECESLIKEIQGFAPDVYDRLKD